MVKEKTRPGSKTNSKEEVFKSLILHNDDVNTFEHVIESLIEICGHEEQQAEQCALITHLKGKCEVKTGPLVKLEPLKQSLSDRKLSVTID